MKKNSSNLWSSSWIDAVLTRVYREVLLQVMVYTGLPNGLQAFRVVDEAIQKYKEEVANAGSSN